MLLISAFFGLFGQSIEVINLHSDPPLAFSISESAKSSLPQLHLDGHLMRTRSFQNGLGAQLVEMEMVSN